MNQQPTENSILFIKNPKTGNFNEKSYCSGWKINNNDYLDFITNDDYSICICKNDFNLKKTVELKTKILYDTKIEFAYQLIDEKSNIVLNITRDDKKTNIDFYKEKILIELKKDDEIIIKIQSENGYCGEVIGIINNMKANLNEYEEIEVYLNTLISNK
jgi:hypothetical protein